MIFKNLIK